MLTRVTLTLSASVCCVTRLTCVQSGFILGPHIIYQFACLALVCMGQIACGTHMYTNHITCLVHVDTAGYTLSSHMYLAVFTLGLGPLLGVCFHDMCVFLPIWRLLSLCSAGSDPCHPFALGNCHPSNHFCWHRLPSWTPSVSSCWQHVL